VSSLGPVAALERAARLHAARLLELEARVRGGDESAWVPYTEMTRLLAEVLVALERRGVLLTTAEKAAQLQVHPETLLERMRRGEITPAVRAGKLIRWRADEALDNRVTLRHNRPDEAVRSPTPPGRPQADAGRARRRPRREPGDGDALGDGPTPSDPRAGRPIAPSPHPGTPEGATDGKG